MRLVPGAGRGAWLRAPAWKRRGRFAALLGTLPALATACEGEPGTLSLFPNGGAHPAAAGTTSGMSGTGGGDSTGSSGGGMPGSAGSPALGGLGGGGRAGPASGGTGVAGSSAGSGSTGGSAAGSDGATAGGGGTAGAGRNGANGGGGTAGASGEAGAAPEGGTTGAPCVLGDCPCVTALDCVQPLPACVNGQCVECAKNSDCDDDHPVCRTETNGCGPCSSTSQCRTGLTCTPEGECSDGL